MKEALRIGLRDDIYLSEHPTGDIQEEADLTGLKLGTQISVAKKFGRCQYIGDNQGHVCGRSGHVSESLMLMGVYSARSVSPLCIHTLF